MHDLDIIHGNIKTVRLPLPPDTPRHTHPVTGQYIGRQQRNGSHCWAWVRLYPLSKPCYLVSDGRRIAFLWNCTGIGTFQSPKVQCTDKQGE